MKALIAPIESAVGTLNFEPQLLFQHFRKRELPKGSYWIREGQVCRKIAFVECGMLRHYRLFEDREVTRWASLAGDYTTSIGSFVSGRASEENLVAIEDTILWELEREVWRTICRIHPQLQAFWLFTVEYLLVCYDDRVWSLMTGNAETRYQYMMERYPHFLLRLPQNFIADLLGIAPRHLSRIRSKAAHHPSLLEK